MNYYLYSHYDRVSGLYSAPIPAVNRASAIRSFVNASKRNETANDFELYEVGSYNVQTGAIDAFEKPVFVCRYDEYGGEAHNE